MPICAVNAGRVPPLCEHAIANPPRKPAISLSPERARGVAVFIGGNYSSLIFAGQPVCGRYQVDMVNGDDTPPAYDVNSNDALTSSRNK